MLSNLTFNLNKLARFDLTFRRLINNSAIYNKKMSNGTVESAIKCNKNKIAICQITCTGDKAQNFNLCKNLIMEAKKQEAKVF